MKRKASLATGRSSISFYLHKKGASDAQPVQSAQCAKSARPAQPVRSEGATAPPTTAPLAEGKKKGLSADAWLRKIRAQKYEEPDAHVPPPKAKTFATTAETVWENTEAETLDDDDPPVPIKPPPVFPLFSEPQRFLPALRPKFYGIVPVPMEPTRQDQIDAIRRVEQRNRMASAFQATLDGADYEVEDVDEEQIGREVDAADADDEDDADEDDADEDDADEEEEEEQEGEEESEEESEDDESAMMNARSLDAKRELTQMRRLRKVAMSEDEED